MNKIIIVTESNKKRKRNTKRKINKKSKNSKKNNLIIEDIPSPVKKDEWDFAKLGKSMM